MKIVKRLFPKKTKAFVAFEGLSFGFYGGDFLDQSALPKRYYGDVDAPKDFKKWLKVEKIKPKKYRVSSPLPDGAYQIFTLPAPEVSSYELKKTVKWILRERIAFNINNLIIDFFYLYTRDLSIDTKKLHVVVVDKAKALKHLMWIHQRGFAIEKLTIKELMFKDRFIEPSMTKMLIVVLLDKNTPLLQILYKGRMMVCAHLSDAFQVDIAALDIKALAANLIEVYGLQVVEYIKESLKCQWLINLPASYITELNTRLESQKHPQICFKSYTKAVEGEEDSPFEMSFLNTMLFMPDVRV